MLGDAFRLFSQNCKEDFYRLHKPFARIAFQCKTVIYPVAWGTLPAEVIGPLGEDRVKRLIVGRGDIKISFIFASKTRGEERLQGHAESLVPFDYTAQRNNLSELSTSHGGKVAKPWLTCSSLTYNVRLAEIR